jgi:hypothetical protein
MLSKGTKLCFEKKTTMLKGLTLIQGSRSLSPILTPRDALARSPLRERTYPTGSRSRATTAAPRGGHPAQHTSTYPRPTGSRSREPTAAPRGARPAPRSRTSPIPRTPVCARPLSTWRYPPSAAPMRGFSRAPTSLPRGASRDPSPPPNTSTRPTVCRSRENPSTLRDVHPSPLPHKGILDATGDLPVPGASPRLNIPSSANPITIAATASRIAWLTAGSRARSAGSSKFSDLKMCGTTMSLRRPGMASPAFAALASRRSRFRLCARVSTPEDMAEGVVCATLCVEAS